MNRGTAAALFCPCCKQFQEASASVMVLQIWCATQDMHFESATTEQACGCLIGSQADTLIADHHI
eukprot:1156579-Pelagomonas_calceolata.AAC.4